jgi:NAD(P)-dependent dehydrogenase (short-subunit alcohol dehydrogenase family)
MMCSLRAELRVIEDGGSIVNISSVQGVMGISQAFSNPFPILSCSILGFPGSAAYSATKHGVIGLTRSCAKEVGAKGIRVVTPLLLKAQETNPEEGKNNPSALRREGTAEEMAGIIAFLLSSEAGYVTGSVYGGDGGWNC